MEFMPANIRGEICRCEAGSSPPLSPGAQGRYDGRLPMGLHVMFWCFVAVLCGTLQLSSGASTVPNTNSTSLTLVLTVPQKHLYSKKALLVWFWHPYEPSPGQVMSYFITYQQEGSNSKTVITVDTAFTSETLRNLQPDEPYRAFVKAVLNSTDVPYIDSALTQFETPKQRFERSSMGVTEFVILFLIFALWGLAMLRFFGTWNKKMNLRVTKDSIRTRDSSPTHRHLEAYRMYKKRRAAAQLAKPPRVRSQDEAGGSGFGRSWQRSSTMKSFRARASNFKRTRFGSSKSSAPPSPLPTAPEREPLRSGELLTTPHPSMQLQTLHHEHHPHHHHPQQHQQPQNQPHNITPPRSQPHAVVIGVPVHVSYEAAGGRGGGSPTATVRLSPDHEPHSVI